MKKLITISILLLALPLFCLSQTRTKVIDPRELPPATATQRGAVRVGAGLKAVTPGVVSLDPIVNAYHIDGVTTAPTASSGVGSGTGASITLLANSNDIAGRVSITAGTSPTAASVIARITFAIPYATPPFVSVQANNLAAALLSLSPYPTNVTTTSFDIALPTGVGLTAATGYLIGYKVIQ